MSSLEKKELSLLSLPDELLLSCIARVSRLYYPTLSLVSKRFRSLIASPELYKTRSLLDQTQSCLYVCIKFCNGYRWFTLCLGSGYFLDAVPIPLSPPADRSALVAVGSNIYNISRFSSVSILDCRSHTWHEPPNQRENMLFLFSASVVNQKIYVSGRCIDGGSNSLKNLVQVFDTKTETFDPMPIRCKEIQGNFFLSSACIDGKFHVKNGRNVVGYNSKEGKWDLVGEVGKYMYTDSYCEIENVLYSVDNHGVIRWYDTKETMWRELNGLVGLPEFPRNARDANVCVKLADYGGKMAVFWEEDVSNQIVGIVKEKMIWCAEIMLERCNNCEILGKVEWFDYVLTVPIFCDFVKVLSVIV